jgi:hypothetical protein
MLNICAFLYHTVLDLCDTRYLFFPNWQALL